MTLQGSALACLVLVLAGSPVQAQFPGGPPAGGRAPGGGPPPLPMPTEAATDLFDPVLAQAKAASPFGVDNPFVKMGAIFTWNGDEGHRLMADIEAGWIMPSPMFGINRQLMERDGKYNFVRHDAYVRFAQSLNIHILFIVGPLEPGAPPPRRGPGGGPGAPKDLAAFSRLVQAVVERYDGDGLDDMPGLCYPIRYWMAHDEPFYDRYWTGTVEQYLDFYLAMHDAARKADPNSMPVLSSLYTPFEENTKQWARTFIDLYLDAARDGRAPRHIDALDFHWITRIPADEGYERYRDAVDWQKNAFAKGDVTIGEWLCTETCMLTSDRDELKRDLVRRYALGRSLGLSKIFWSSLVSADANKDPFTAISLKVTDNDPIIDAYRVMVAMMASGPCTLKQEGDRFVVSCENGNRIAWSRKPVTTPPDILEASACLDLAGAPLPAVPPTLTTAPIYLKP